MYVKTAYFLMLEIKDRSLLCFLDSCDAQTHVESDLASLCICPSLLVLPTPGASVRSVLRLLRTFWPANDGSTFVLL